MDRAYAGYEGTVTIVYFILLLGGLIFFHELGHFVVGRLLGVRVLKFALGFGPKIPFLSFTRKGTEYCINVFPLGGYVKFHGDDPTEELEPGEAAGSFFGAPLWKRFLIVFAGPFFNLILPFVIYFPVYLAQGEATPPVVGAVYDGGPAAEAGLVPGDKILTIDGESIGTWWEMQRVVTGHPGEALEIVVERDGTALPPKTIVPDAVERPIVPQLAARENVGRIQIVSAWVAPIVAVLPGSTAADAGLRTWDRVVAIDDRDVSRWDQVERWLANHEGPTARVTVLRPGPPATAGYDEPDKLGGDEVTLTLPVIRATDGSVSGIHASEMLVAEVTWDSPATRDAGLLPGDRVVSVDGRAYPTWSFALDDIVNHPDESHTVRFAPGPWHGVLRGLFGEVWAAAVPGAPEPGAATVERGFELRQVIERDDMGLDRKLWLFGARTRSRYVEPDKVPIPAKFRYALLRTWDQAWADLELTVLSVVGLVSGQVPLKDLGGPILIANLAGRTAELGWIYFLRMMVLLSINLAILNLLPIPVLDGGHLMFFTIEAIRRRPLSIRTRQIATYFGLAVILLLMVLVFKNDLERNWSNIVGFFGCHANF